MQMTTEQKEKLYSGIFNFIGEKLGVKKLYLVGQGHNSVFEIKEDYYVYYYNLEGDSTFVFTFNEGDSLINMVDRLKLEIEQKYNNFKEMSE